MSSSKNIFTAGVVRFIALLVFAFGIILIFKNDISRTMEGGCFSISVDYADTGFNLSDQKYCTSEDIEGMAESLVELGATNVENEADKIFLEYEAQIKDLVTRNNDLATQINRQNEMGKQIVENNQNFGNYLNRLASIPSNPTIVKDIQNYYAESFGLIVPSSVISPNIAIIDPVKINQSTTLIRADFNSKSRKITKNISSNLKVKR